MDSVFVATRVSREEAEVISLLSRKHGHSMSAELREAIRAHLANAAKALNDDGPQGRQQGRQRQEVRVEKPI